MGKHRAVYPAGAGISVQAAALTGPAEAGAWTVPPGGLRFIQLALPNEEGRDRRLVKKGEKEPPKAAKSFIILYSFFKYSLIGLSLPQSMHSPASLTLLIICLIHGGSRLIKPSSSIIGK